MKERMSVIVAFTVVALVSVLPVGGETLYGRGAPFEVPLQRGLYQGTPYADRVVVFSPGNPIGAQFSNPQAVLGPPDFNLDALSGFLNLGVGGSITLEFTDNVATDGPGVDLAIYGDPTNDGIIHAKFFQ